jgi:hypothetical protein
VSFLHACLASALSLAIPIDRDSKPRPLLRGWLHGILTVLLLGFLIGSLVSKEVGTLLGSREEQLGFIVGKLLSCGASASYHLIDFRSPTWLRWLNIFDLLFVPIAVWALVSGGSSASPWGDDRHERWVNNLYLIGAVEAATVFGVWLQFRTGMNMLLWSIAPPQFLTT